MSKYRSSTDKEEYNDIIPHIFLGESLVAIKDGMLEPH